MDELNQQFFSHSKSKHTFLQMQDSGNTRDVFFPM